MSTWEVFVLCIVIGPVLMVIGGWLFNDTGATYDWRCKHCGVGGRSHSVHGAEIASRDHLRRVHYCNPEIMPHA